MKVSMTSMMILFRFISATPIAASMEVIKPSWRRLHPRKPQGSNEEEDG